ncbi:DUF7220 family protein [Bradyrhizobium oligotrophicum]|uniref:DUF7220 family protein n=1 Tax=Bradyrhizobium TaxID=374 RepID=UPI003EBF9EC0
MKQSRMMSAIETVASTATGFGLSLLLQWLVLPPLLGHPVPFTVNLAFAAVMTVASLARQYVLRRLFEALHIRRPLSPFVQAGIAERFRQIEQEGFSIEHDDRYPPGELGRAGAMYALYAGTSSTTPPHDWPWPGEWWKPAGRRRDLVRAFALIVAEGEKFDRDRKRGRGL